MSFELKRREPVAAGVRRLSGVQLRKASAMLAGAERDDLAGDLDAAVHQARVRLKRVRALIALVRDSLPDAGKEAREAKAAAASLAGLRDSASMLAAFQLVRDRFATLDPDAFNRAAETLQSDAQRSAACTGRRETLQGVADALASAASRAEEWDLSGHGFGLLRPGLLHSYKRGRADLRESLESQDGEVRHRWRSRVKRLANQLAILRPMWPESIGAQVGALQAVAAALGDDHDLWLLARMLEQDPERFGDPHSVKNIAKLARRCGRRSVHLAGKPARRALAETPDAFIDRIERLWDAWRAG